MFNEYYFDKFNFKSTRKKSTKNLTLYNELNLAKSTYLLLRHYYSNPLSLQELSRIQIRKTMLNLDYNIKDKIENQLI